MTHRTALPLTMINDTMSDADLGISVATSIVGIVIGLLLLSILALDSVTSPDHS